MSTNYTIGSGLAGQLVAKNETTYGVAPSFSSGIDTYEFNSETMKLTKTAVQGEGLHGKSDALPLYERTSRRVVTNYAAAGDITLDLPSSSLGFWITHMIGSYGQSTIGSQGTNGVWTQVHNPGSLQGSSFAFQKGVPATDGTVLPFTYVGCKVESWTVTVETGKIATLQLKIDSRNELAGAGNSDPLNSSVPSLATPSYTSGMELFHFREATLYTGGTPAISGGTASLTNAGTAAAVTKAEFTHAVTLDKTRYFLGSSGFKSEQLESGYRKISGSLSAEFTSDEDMYNAFSADTTTSLELTFVGPVIGSTSTHSKLDILIPNVKLDGETPNIAGPGIVTPNIPWTGLDDESTTQIQITYVTGDSSL